MSRLVAASIDRGPTAQGEVRVTSCWSLTARDLAHIPASGPRGSLGPTLALQVFGTGQHRFTVKFQG